MNHKRILILAAVALGLGIPASMYAEVQANAKPDFGWTTEEFGVVVPDFDTAHKMVGDWVFEGGGGVAFATLNVNGYCVQTALQNRQSRGTTCGDPGEYIQPDLTTGPIEFIWPNLSDAVELNKRFGALYPEVDCIEAIRHPDGWVSRVC